MFCDNCGAKIEEGQKFCTECGKPVQMNNSAPGDEDVTKSTQKTDTVKKATENEKLKKTDAPKKEAPKKNEQAPIYSEPKEINNQNFGTYTEPGFVPQQKPEGFFQKIGFWFKNLTKGKKILVIIGLIFLLSIIFGGKDKDEKVETTTYPSTTRVTTTESTTKETTTDELQSKAKDAGEKLANSLLDRYLGTDSSSSGKNTFKQGETFQFDDFELTVEKSYTKTKIDNMFSDNDGKTVIKVPVKVKNVSDETSHLSSFYITYFGSKGTEIDDVEYYFDDSIDDSKDFRPGAEAKKYIYLLYDGSGTYAVEFEYFSETKTVEIEVK